MISGTCGRVGCGPKISAAKAQETSPKARKKAMMARMAASLPDSVVNLKFLESAWHPLLGTSNSRTTRESIECGFESENRARTQDEIQASSTTISAAS